ncbi:MAG: NAD(+) synthase [Pseudomonadota bacterium]
MSKAGIDARVLELDMAQESERISLWLRDWTARIAHKRGLVVAVSGGIDSSVCLGLSVRALGAKRVFALLLPEQDSNDGSGERGRELVAHLGVRHEHLDIASALEALGCYRWRDEAVRSVIPDFGVGWRMKIVLEGGQEGSFNRFKVVARSPAEETFERILPLSPYLQVVAATNFKQRVRKTVEYCHADRLNYAVVGTPNLLEYDQGFFVKNGDGSADIKPIAHLYKTQVYAMARHLGLPAAICAATPTTDTYSLEQSQEEFYFGLPYAAMDLALWCVNHGESAETLARALNIESQKAIWIYEDIAAKRRAARYLHASPETLLPR